MRLQRVTADELRQAGRRQGHPDLSDVRAVVLETDGTLSLLTDSPTLRSLRPGTATGQQPGPER